MNKNNFGCINALILIIYFSLSFYDLIFIGIFEKPSLFVEHHGGAIRLLIRAIFGILSFFLFFKLLMASKKVSHVFINIFGMLITVALFIVMGDGLHKSSKNYSEDEFMKIVRLYFDDIPIDQDYVLSKLGKPIIIEETKYKTYDSWLYRYSPSCSYVYRERVIYFTKDGQVGNIDFIDD